jgi:dUTP pyrophosphatase
MASERTAVLRYVKLTKNAFSPTKESTRAAGFDLKSAYNVVIPAGGNTLLQADLAVQLPTGCYAQIASHSGMALHHKISVLGV